MVVSEPETLWHKLNHLLYLPILNLTRPRDLYYYQGDGLRVLYGFTYKYLTLEHFLGQMTRLTIGQPLAERLAQCYSQAWYPGDAPLFIFSDWHVKPHWTKHYAHSGHVTMWERVMPGTKQLIINGPSGYLLGGWNYAIDTHLSHLLVELEAELATLLGRPIAYNIFDSEGSGQPIARRYAEAQREYISVLPRQGDQSLAAFQVQGTWQPVEGDPDREAVNAQWANAQKAAVDPRRLVLMRPVGGTDPTRVYAGRIPAHISAAEVPATHRQRWQYQERRIREMVNGANLNANFGYTYDLVPNRTRRRRWQEAQAKVEVTQRKLAEREEAITNLWAQLKQLKQTYTQQWAAQQATIKAQREELAERQQAGKRTRRCEQRLARMERQLAGLATRFQRRRRRLIERLCRHRTQRSQLRHQLAEREAARDAIDTETLCRERHLEKDQVMMKDRLDAGKTAWPRAGLAERVAAHLDAMQRDLYARARRRVEENSLQVESWDEFVDVYADGRSKFVYAHWDGTGETEAIIQEETKATVRCIPLDDDREEGACVYSGKPSARRVLFAKAY